MARKGNPISVRLDLNRSSERTQKWNKQLRTLLIRLPSLNRLGSELRFRSSFLRYRYIRRTVQVLVFLCQVTATIYYKVACLSHLLDSFVPIANLFLPEGGSASSSSGAPLEGIPVGYLPHAPANEEEITRVATQINLSNPEIRMGDQRPKRLSLRSR